MELFVRNAKTHMTYVFLVPHGVSSEFCPFCLYSCGQDVVIGKASAYLENWVLFGLASVNFASSVDYNCQNFVPFIIVQSTLEILGL